MDLPLSPPRGVSVDVRSHGARGDGVALDSPGINAAIAAVANAGGGTVILPAGRYLSYSLRLRSRVELRFAAGAVLVAAAPSPHLGAYDPPEPNDWGDRHQYQDFGHSHWHNSLLWGEDLEDVSITGPGFIDGTAGLERDASYRADGPNGTVAAGSSGAAFPPELVGVGNKAIALKNCRRVTLRDFSLLAGGHFAVLATGVDHLTIERLRIDTNRDGLDLDGCRFARVTDCVVNAPNDDAIVLKTSYALGALRACEHITITRCIVSGFDVGSVLDGSRRSTLVHAPDRDGPTGRIKLGTESNGAFRDITIAQCTFERSRGLAIESVDGAVIEDVRVSDLTMTDVTSSPIFLRLGHRARGPVGTPVGAIRRVRIERVTATGVDGRFPSIIAGLPGHPIEDVTLAAIRVASRGGIAMRDVASQPDALVNAFFLRGDEAGVRGPREPHVVPERARAYPEPSMFGLLPASVLYARHVAGLTIRDFSATTDAPDVRPAVVLDDARHIGCEAMHLPARAGSPAFVLRSVADLRLQDCPAVPDSSHAQIDRLELHDSSSPPPPARFSS